MFATNEPRRTQIYARAHVALQAPIFCAYSLNCDVVMDWLKVGYSISLLWESDAYNYYQITFTLRESAAGTRTRLIQQK